MKFTLCPRCEMNYMPVGEHYCKVCLQEMRGYAAPEEVELCSVCNENPVAPGHDVCLQCLREMQNNEELQGDNDDQQEAMDAEGINGVESVAEMDEIIPEMENSPEYGEMAHTLSLESVREDEEKEQDEADAEDEER